MGGEPTFELEGVTLRRGGVSVLDRVTGCIPAGACTGLVGPSGAGKSTLLRLLTRIEEQTAGRITFHGLPLADHDVLQLRRRVQLVTQQSVLLTDSVVDEVRLGAPHLTPTDVQALLTRVGLAPTFLRRVTSGLSGGEAQRVVLARALALRPEVLLLDEPTSALDATSAAAIATTVRAHVSAGGTVLVVSHDTRQVRRIADQVWVMEAGSVVATGAPALLQSPEEAS
jgi:putative ABC transport system ATP-binding protein